VHSHLTAQVFKRLTVPEKCWVKLFLMLMREGVKFSMKAQRGSRGIAVLFL
jgi:hypothetical protein